MCSKCRGQGLTRPEMETLGRAGLLHAVAHAYITKERGKKIDLSLNNCRVGKCGVAEPSFLQIKYLRRLFQYRSNGLFTQAGFGSDTIVDQPGKSLIPSIIPSFYEKHVRQFVYFAGL